MDPIYVILIAIFAVIFLATATLTICALPGWIKIPDNYLKILFSSLILEVIACVFVVFNIVRPSAHKCEDALKHKAGNNWVIINEKGKVFPLYLNDSVISTDINAFSREAREQARFTLVKEESQDGVKYFVKNDSSIYMGRLYDKSLANLNLFNEINMDQSEFKRIHYTKNNGQWAGDALPKKWSLRITVSNAGYAVADSNTDYYEESANSFDKGKRKLHSFRGSDNAFYIVGITDADNSSEEKQHFVTFMIIRTEMESKLN